MRRLLSPLAIVTAVLAGCVACAAQPPAAARPAGPPAAKGTATGHSTSTVADARGCPPTGDGRTIVDYADFVNLAGRMYQAGFGAPPTTVGQAALGEQVGTVACELSKIQPSATYPPHGGDAAFLPAGTGLYAVRGYPTWFRLAARSEGAYRLYESDTSAVARTGADLLPIRGKVASIRLMGADTGTRVLFTVTDPARVRSLVDAVLASPVIHGQRPGQAAFFVRFDLIDGTWVQRAWFTGEGILGAPDGIRMPPALVAALR